MKAYKDLVSPAFDQHLYADEKYEFRALRWVMKREINLRGFSMEVKSISGRLNRKSGPVLAALMLYGDLHLDLARYYLARAS